MPPLRDDPEFGRPIPVRRTSHAAWLAAVIISMYTCMFVALIPTAFPSGKAASMQDVLVYSAFIAAGVLGLIAIAYHEGNSIRFYEKGVVRKQFGVTRVRLVFADCVKHDYRMLHRRHHMGYDSTLIRLHLDGSDGERVRYFGTHRLKTKRSGPIFFSRSFEVIEDHPIEYVAWRVAWLMATNWVQRLDEGESIDWTKFTTLTPDGIVAWDGPAKHSIALYHDLQQVEIDGAHAHVRTHGGALCITVETEEPNFYPGYLAAYIMIDRASPDTESIDGEAT